MAPPSSDKTNHSTECEGNKLNREEKMTWLLKEASIKINSDYGTLKERQRASEPVLKSPVERGKFLGVMGDVDDQLTGKLNAQVVRVTKETLVDITETVNTNRSKVFIRWWFRSVAHEKCEGNHIEGWWDSRRPEYAIIWVPTSGPKAQAIVGLADEKEQLVAPVARFVAKQMKTRVSEAAQQWVLAAPLSSPPLPLE